MAAPTVKAILRGGLEVKLDPGLGATARDVIVSLTGDSLIGSAAPPEMWLQGADGSMIRYGDVARFENIPTEGAT